MKNKTPATIEDFANTKNYLNPLLLFSFGYPIVEYDISKANINILRSYSKINEFDYQKLMSLPKDAREIEIGKRIIHDWSLQNCITEGIAKAKYQFLLENNINTNNILRIANDAFYLIGNNPITTTSVCPVGGEFNIDFAFKKKYNFYIKLNSVLFFSNNTDSDWDLDVVGVGNDKLDLHKEFLTFLCTLSDKYIIGGKEMAIRYINMIHHSYVSDELNIDFYREFNSGSSFRYPIPGSIYLSLFPLGMKGLDKSYNLDLIRTIYSYILAS